MKKSASTSNIIWRAKEYHDLSIAQYVAASNLLDRLNVAADDHIIDIGCGNGKITANLSKIASRARVLGIDKSHEMISFANENFANENYPNLTFKIQDAENLFALNTFDIVFSSFALQWIEDKNRFFKNAYNVLRKDGRLAVITPLGISTELQKAVDSIIALSEWSDYFQEFHPGWFFSNKNTIKHLVKENCFRIKYFSSCIQKVVFPSRESFEKYVLLWLSYLIPIPEELKSKFFDKIMEKYFKILPIRSNGTAILRIPRLDLIAEKITF